MVRESPNPGFEWAELVRRWPDLGPSGAGSAAPKDSFD